MGLPGYDQWELMSPDEEELIPTGGKMGLPKMRFCCICGAELGVYAYRDYDRRDTCGAHECDREMRDQDRAERDEAHERLDRDHGWGGW